MSGFAPSVSAAYGRFVLRRMSGARALLAQVDSMSRGFVPMPLHTAVYVAQAWAELGESGQVVRWLEKYDRPGDLHFQLHLRCDPPFDRIRGKSDYAPLRLGGGC